MNISLKIQKKKTHLKDLNIILYTGANQFQTNPLEHESDDRIDNPVSFVCVTSAKDMAPQQQI